MNFGIIQKLAKCIVRPPRIFYSQEQMGAADFELQNRFYEREDFTVINNRSLELKCSFIKDKYAPIARETIIFLHANSSSRLIINNYVDIFLPYFDLLSFDFAGCGLSEGQFVTLGYNQKEDVYSVIKRIRERHGVKDIILWGRSMGAATALLYAAKYKGIKAIVADNSFSDLQELVNQLSEDYLPILPSFIVNTIMDSIQQYIEQNVWKRQMTKFNIRKLKPIAVIQKVQCPIFFIGSIQDTFVNTKHTKRLHMMSKSYKKLQLVDGDHNDLRSEELKQKVLKFLIDLNIKSPQRKSLKQRTNIFKYNNGQKWKIASKKLENKFKVQPRKQLAFKDNLPNPSCSDFQRQMKWNRTINFSREGNIPMQSRPMLDCFYITKNRQYHLGSCEGRQQSKAKRRKIFAGDNYMSKHISQKLS